MWIVRLALRRPHTFVVMAMLIVLLGLVTLLRMPTDIFPEIDIPVISVIWNYAGLAPQEMERRIIGNYERALTTTVNDIEHIESQSLTGVAVVKIYFQPGARIEAATAQVTAISQAVLRQFPPGVTPPLVIRYSASNVPILQASLASDTLPEQQLFDLGANFLRGGLAVVQGAQIPWPYGGKQRQVMVDLDLARLSGLGLSPADVSNAISAQNLVLPSGTLKLGTQELQVDLNSSPDAIEELNHLPVKTLNGTVITIGDVANVRDGYSPQTSMVHVDGKRGALLSILKSQGSSTLDIVDRVRATMPTVLSTLPKEFKVTLLFDQSVFVRAAVDGVVREAIIAAALTGLMMLIFLGSWRSTLIVVVSIPLSILVSIIVMNSLGQTLNVMTLGGLSLAVGILVDDATVELENIHRNLGQKKPLVRAILDGAQQIAVPALVSTLCICIVFVPVAFISGAAKSLFVPMAMAVVFAMLTSYLLSRTLVPTMVQALLKREVGLYGGEVAPGTEVKPDVFWRLHQRFNVVFERFRMAYAGLLAWVLKTRAAALLLFVCFVVVSVGLATQLGQDFFPAVDAGLLKLHVRAPAGTRIEETERLFARIEDVVREVIPPDELDTVLDNIGVPYSGINLSLGDPSMISSADGEVLIALKEHHHPTIDYQRRLRRELADRFPRESFFFLAPDISTQVLNFGLSAPIDIQFIGPPGNQQKNYELAQKLKAQLQRVPGAVDVHLHQVVAAPALHVEVDRVMAGQLGVTQRDVASDMLVSLSSSGQTAPSYWLDKKKGVQYLVAVQTPQYRVDTLEAFEGMPVGGLKKNGAQQLLGNLAQVTRTQAPVNITHQNAAGTLDVLLNVDRRDLGAVATDVEALVTALKAELPRGTTVAIRGQVQSMRESFGALAWGLIFAIVLVYLLLVVNFHSWLDPAIILMALPGALSGLIWLLFATGTTLSVPALMGAIMSIGVATANSILLVSFANEQRGRGYDATQAALAAGMTRLRPVLMTALAMMVGMLPMSLGLGEGGEQNAPLARAVIGGLLVATLTTLFIVPTIYSLLRRAPPAPELDELQETA
jgi:multidrug efflux pump subunit AcrB